MFERMIVCTDQHFGRSGGSPVACNDSLEFIKWFCERGKTLGIKTAVLCGDYFHNRHSITLLTLDYALRSLELLNESFDKVFCITGNHDLMYRDKRDVSSTAFVRNLSNFIYVNEPLTLEHGHETVSFIPWLTGKEAEKVKRLKSRYIFGHFEMGGYMMNARVPMPFHDTGIQSEDFRLQEYVFSGHFHHRQSNTRTRKDGAIISYIGATMPYDFSDDHDEDKGLMILEWGRDPVFEAWPDQPLFRTMNLSDLINDPKRFLRPKVTARVSMDVDLTFEQMQFIKDDLAQEYQLRRLELIPSKQAGVNDQDAAEVLKDVKVQTVDQIVYEGLNALDSEAFDSATLRDIYVDCSENTKR